jgi:hypothetical protein
MLAICLIHKIADHKQETARLTDRVGSPVSEREVTGRLGQKGREEVGRG